MTYNLTDLGNAERLMAQHGPNLRYVHAWKRWLFWDESHWAFDETGEIMRRASLVVREIDCEASQETDRDRREALRSWAMKSESAARHVALVELAKSRSQVLAIPPHFDRDPLLLNVQNGTLDLRTGELRDHRRADLITKLAPVAFDAGSTCPRWEAFLGRVLPSEELRAFVQRAIGYSLTGSTREHVLFLAHGTGANGKSVFLETVRAAVGDYASNTPSSTFLEKRGGAGIPNDLAALVGARLVTASESGESQRLDEGLVKLATGGDVVSARFMRGEFFDFTPAFKLWFATNHRPRIRGTDEGIWRRIRLIPFAVTIPEGQRDKTLPDALRGELPGILAWAVRGCLAWQQSGLGTAAEVMRATADYRVDQDRLGDFLTECCVELPHAFVSRVALRKRYEAWAASGGENPLGTRELYQRLRERFTDEQLTTGARERGFRGLGLLTDVGGPGEQTNRSEQSFEGYPS